jgi:hypothetical protein
MKIALATALLSLAGTIALAQSPGTFSSTGSMTTTRVGHTAILLLNGKVLIAGGWGPNNSILASAEIYDPQTGTFSSTGDMTIPLLQPTSTLLPNGQVLIFGFDVIHPPYPFRAEVYDPPSGTFTPAGGSVENLQLCAFPTLLANGKVLVSGGAAYLRGNVLGMPTYLYDRTTETFSATGSYVTATDFSDDDTCPTVVRLADGKVLTTWRSWKAEVYNPITGIYSPTGDQDPPGGSVNTSTLLMNGKVLIAGGTSYSTNALYDPATERFTATGHMNVQRVAHTATLLSDGTVLIAAGIFFNQNYPMYPASAELFQPDSGTFTATDQMVLPRAGHTATLLADGSVLISGGRRGDWFLDLASAEIYRPVITRPAPALLSLANGQAAILHASTQQAVSQDMPATPGEAIEVYMTGLIDSSVIPPQVFIGGQMGEVLFFGNAPGFPGLNQINVRVPGGVTLGPGVSVRLSYLGRYSNQVTLAVQ